MRRFGIWIAVLFFLTACLVGAASLQNTSTGFRNISPAVDAALSGIDRERSFNLADPNSLQALDDEWEIWKRVPAAMTITRIEVELNTAAQDIVANLVYADDFITQANPVIINALNTSSGVLDDSSPTVGAVPAGKAMFVDFDGNSPNAAITQAFVQITYDND